MTRAASVGSSRSSRRIRRLALSPLHVLNIRGESYRLKDRRQARLLASYPLLNPSPEEPNNTKSQDRVGQFHSRDSGSNLFRR